MDYAPVKRQLKREWTAGKRPKISSRKNLAHKESGCYSSRLNSQEGYDDDDIDDDEYVSYLRDNAEVLEVVGSPGSSVEANNGYGYSPDQQYESFLNHLRQDRKSYTAVFEKDDGERIMCKYETEQHTCYEELNVQPKSPKLMNHRVSVQKEIAASASKSRIVLSRERSKNLGNPEKASKRKRNDKGKSLKKEPSTGEAIRVPKASKFKRRRDSSTNKNEAVQDGNDAARRREECQKRTRRSRQFTCSEKQQEESEDWEESYLVFMLCIRNDGDVLLLNHDAGNVRYEGDEVEENSSSSDLEILDQEDILKNEGNNPFVITTTPRIDLDVDDLWEPAHSEFREKLLEILKKPYDAEEYEDLLQKARRKRRKEKMIQLRGGRERSCVTKELCESYLEQYADLAEKIFRAKGDKFRTLNLLRGLFFYLSNVTMSGVFQPWADPCCSDILPPLPPLPKQLTHIKGEPLNTLPPTTRPLGK